MSASGVHPGLPVHRVGDPASLDSGARRASPRAAVAVHRSEAAFERLAVSYPSNPFATRQYAAARTAGGTDAVVLSFEGGGPPAYCLGLLTGGPLARVLEIPSLPDLPAGDFAAPMAELLRRLSVGLLNVYPYHSTNPVIPPWFPAEWRRATHEYIWYLAGPPEVSGLHKSARHGARNAARAGCRFVAGTAELLASHDRLLAESRRRRSDRGERVGVAPKLDRMRAFLEHGAAEIHQVLGADGATHSSALVLRGPGGAYLHSMGGSDVGFEVGAGKLLVLEGARRLAGLGATEFNLGSGSTEGLRAFKSLFGAQPRPVEAALLAPMAAWSRRLRGSADRLRALVAGRRR